MTGKKTYDCKLYYGDDIEACYVEVTDGDESFRFPWREVFPFDTSEVGQPVAGVYVRFLVPSTPTRDEALTVAQSCFGDLAESIAAAPIRRDVTSIKEPVLVEVTMARGVKTMSEMRGIRG